MVNQKEYPRELYTDDFYLPLNVFLSHYAQIKEVIKTKPKKVLEIGPGSGIVSSILKNLGYEVTTCDFNKNLKPDILADIRKLPIKDKTYDTVVACEILEHIPFEDVPTALNELRRVANYVVISVPYATLSFGLISRAVLPAFSRFMKLNIKIPYSWFTARPESRSHPGHYWAIGRRNYSKKRVSNLLRRYFFIKNQFSTEITRHYFFILKSKP